MKTAYILPHKDKIWYDVSTPYDSDFVSSLKIVINPSMRRWDPETKLWAVHYSVLSELKDILRLYFDRIVEEKETKQEIPKIQPEKKIDIIAEIFKICPSKNVDELYKGLAKSFHPDKGGDTEIMKKINKEYNERK